MYLNHVELQSNEDSILDIYVYENHVDVWEGGCTTYKTKGLEAGRKLLEVMLVELDKIGCKVIYREYK